MTLLKNVEFKNGVLIWLLVGFYFLLMDSLGLANEPYLKIFNVAFILLGVNLTVKHYAEKGYAYTKLFAKGVSTAMIGIGLSLVGLFIYFEFMLGGVSLNDYSTTVIPTTDLSRYFIALFAEGLSTSVVITFAILQYWKNYEPELSNENS